MNRALPALLLGLVAACAAPLQTSPPIPVPIPTIPADLCAHAQLHVVNTSTQADSVNLNGTWAIVSEPSSDHLIVDYEAEGPPPLPWTVELHDQQGRPVMRFTVDAPDSALVSITENGVAQTATNIADGCSPSTSPSALARSSADPYAGLPSNACGGFHLKVVNDTSSNVTVAINEAWNTTVDAGASQVINQGFSQPQPPVLPWHVVIANADRQSIFTGTVGDTPVDQKLTLSDDAAPVQVPYDLTEGC